MKLLNQSWRAVVHISTVLYLLAENIKLRLQLRYLLLRQNILLFKQRNLTRRCIKLGLEQRIMKSRSVAAEKCSPIQSVINLIIFIAQSSLTKKAEPPRTYDSRQPKPSRTTASDTRGWLRRLVRHRGRM